MGIFGKIFGIQYRETTQTTSDTEVPVTVGSAVAAVDSLTSSKMEVDELTSFAVAAYHAGVEMIAKQFAIMPFRYMSMNKTKGVYEEREGDPMHYLLSVRPQPNMSAYMWRYMLAKQFVHFGEAFVYPRMINDIPMQLVLIKDHGASYQEVNHTYNVTDTINGVYERDIEEDKILHFIWNSPDGYHGDAAWWLAKSVLDIYATGDKETQKRFESGGNVSGIVGNSQQQTAAGIGNYKTETLNDVASSIEQKFRQGSKIVAVPGDARFTPFTSSSADMQMTEQQKRIVLDIARHLGIPPYMLGVESSGTQYNTPETAQKAFLTQTLEPMLQMVENEFQGKLVSHSKCHYYIFKFDRDEVFALDLKSKAEYYEAMLRIGAMTINDIRRKENLPQIEGADEVVCSANFMTLEALKAKGITPVAPAAPAEPTIKDEPKQE